MKHLSMDHIKLLELEMLLKFEEVGGYIVHSDFNKVFPIDTAQWYAIWQGLQAEGYLDYGQYFIGGVGNTTSAYGITQKGKLRLAQLAQEKEEEASSRRQLEPQKKPFFSKGMWKVIIPASVALIGSILVYIKNSDKGSVTQINKSGTNIKADRDVNITYDYRDTGRKETPKIINPLDTSPKIIPPKEKTPKRDSNKPKYDIHGNKFDGPTQIGDGNTQNNFGEAEKIPNINEILPEINKFTRSKDVIIRLEYENTNASANKKYCKKILDLLQDNGYKNSFIDYTSFYMTSPDREITYSGSEKLIAMRINLE